MIEAFPVLCACRSFICRKQCLIFHGDLNGIFQDSFGIAGMGSDSVNRNNCRSGIEVFIGKLTDQAAVDGIAIGSADLFEVYVVWSAADFFIRSEQDGNRWMRIIRILHQKFCQSHDLCHAGFVVCTKQGSAIGDDQILANECFQIRKYGNSGDNVLLFIEDDVISVIIADDAWFDIVTGHVHGSVHMRNECQTGAGAALCSRNMAVYIAVFIGVGVSNTESFQLICQPGSQNQLSFGGRYGGAGNVRLGAVLYII